MQRQEAGELRRGGSARVCLTSEQTLKVRVLSVGNPPCAPAGPGSAAAESAEKSDLGISYGPVVGTQCFHCCGPTFNPRSGKGKKINKKKKSDPFLSASQGYASHFKEKKSLVGPEGRLSGPILQTRKLRFNKPKLSSQGNTARTRIWTQK